MGLSGYKGTVEVGSSGLTHEVIKFDLNPTAYKREYGSDKSAGWQQVCYGIKRIEGTIEVKSVGGALDFGPAEKVTLTLYPYGETEATAITGKAGIDGTPMSVNVENGEPVSATYRFASDGAWTGLPNDGDEWGGFEDLGS